MEPLGRIELPTSSLPWKRSATELQRQLLFGKALLRIPRNYVAVPAEALWAMQLSPFIILQRAAFTTLTLFNVAKAGADARIRTGDLRFTKPLL